ncbi:MAG: efflux RND transporter periplasmic adaptor subunit [Acidobacteria bacterium]|nr:efflux RND transporter periplasmic adaptor subunit [Acidobacteriota bacterium]
MKELLHELRLQDDQKPRNYTKGLSRPIPARYWLLLASLAVLGAMGWAWRARQQPAVKVDVLTVSTVPQGAAPRVTLTAGGYVKDPVIVYVVPRIYGRIEAIFVQEGDNVRSGQLLARLDTRDLRKDEEEALANFQSAQFNLSKLRAGPRPEEIAETKARLAAALHAKDRTYRDFNRSQSLVEAGAISGQEFDRIQAEYLIAEKNAAAVTHSLALLEAGTRKDDLQAAEAAVAASQARLEAARNRLSYAEVRAPISGRVLKKYRESGDRVSPDVPFVQAYDTVAVGSPVVSIAALDDQEVSADINETVLPKVAVHQAVEVAPNAYPNEKWTGRVTRVAPRSDKNKNTIEVRVTLEHGAKRLPHDMSAKLSFVETLAGPKTEGIEIPEQAVWRQSGKSYVLVAAGGFARQREVRTGRVEGGKVRVLSGLAEGDQVILPGAANLKEGSAITLR